MRITTNSQFRSQSELLSNQMTDMLKYMTQLNTGVKLQSSSEDPVLATQIKAQGNYAQKIEQYKNNGTLAQNRIERFSTIMRQSVTAVDNLLEVARQAQSTTWQNTDKGTLANQAVTQLTQLVNYANTTDSNGSYIFSGFKTNVQPYVTSSGSYVYQGGYTQANIEIGENAQALYYENGFDVFNNILNGNGLYTIAAGASNTGSAYADPGVITDRSAYIEDTYTITFVTNSAGELAYQVVGASEGQVIPTPPAAVPADAPAYATNSNINFNGININLNGGPAVGDTFTIAPSTTENVFNITQDLINVLNNKNLTLAQFNQAISQLSEELSHVSQHLIDYQTEIGANANSVKQVLQNNTATSLNTSIILNGLNDSDTLYQSAASNLARTQMAIQSTSSCYLRLQEILMQILQM